MERREILSLLQKFGLTEYESAVYSTLVFLGPSKAGLISKESNVPQSKIYGVLEQLVRKQLVEFVGGRPKEFKAIPPKVALKTLLEIKQKELDALGKTIDLLSKHLKPMKTEEILEGVWTMKGKGLRDFLNRLIEMFNKTEKYAYVITRDFTWSSELAKAVKACIRRGAKIRTITVKGIDESNFYRAKWFASYGVNIRFLKTRIHPRIILTDGREVLIRLDHNPTRKVRFPFTSIYSADPALVRVFDIYMKNLWKLAKPVNFEKLAIKI